MKIVWFFSLFTLTSCATLFCSSGNLHVVEEDKGNGFALYRSGWPDEELIAEYCKLGISEIMVLSGNASMMEERLKSACPTLKVVYNQAQSTDTPLDRDFLEEFDRFILKSKQAGKRVAIRCDCGSHRTGRLAAYYQMKYQGMSATEAKAVMTEKGKWMSLFSNIYEQVDALSDYIHGKNCSTKELNCVRTNTHSADGI
ncbi:MAG: dual specificity protein phosphatase family protein [Oligoflexia bacterium]|nr:dual specificity protein phosphatase family protein [Oligoflexia bacterium]MBF0364894.1 dual specificity protein phosphatase family protein [Oligoflexia bacterium]